MEKHAGSLSAIKDATGNIITNRQLLEDIVLEQLVLIFSGKKSPIFTSRNEQIIKEITVKEGGGWEDWIKVEKQPTEYENEVCAPVTSKLVQDLIS